jgi:DNA repair exonuclease SbcCD ATPase subunit
MQVTKGWSFALALGVCLAGQVAQAGETTTNYSWVDKNGERHYGDSVPPEYAQSERRVLNNQGVEVQHVDAEMNATQRADQLKRQQAEQQRAQHDNFLLTTYTSTKDIERLRDERLDQLDGQIKAANAYMETLDARLKTLQARALLFKPYSTKPDARRMPDDLAEQLVRAASDLRAQHKAMDKRLQDQTDVRAQFEADIARYRELTASRSTS